MTDLTAEQKTEKYARYLELDEKLIPAHEKTIQCDQELMNGLKAERATLKDELTSFWPRQKPGPKPKAQRKPRVKRVESLQSLKPKPTGDADQAALHEQSAGQAEIPGKEFDLK